MNDCSHISNALKDRGVSVAFGIPGIHNLPLYSAFHDSGFQMVTVRHEQSAAFMADGYARASGKCAACLLIDGPGFLNAATGIAQAKADSIPMIVLTPGPDSTARGQLHELCGQGQIARQLCRDHLRLSENADADDLSDFLDCNRSTTRSGPVHIEIPLSDAIETCSDHRVFNVSNCHPKKIYGDFEKASSILNEADSPLVIAGGGAIEAQPAIRLVVETLDAPLINTVNAKGILHLDHPLRVGYSPSLPEIRSAIAKADVVLAVGTELGETDFDFLMLDEPLQFQQLIRIDSDPKQVNCNAVPCCAIVGEATEALACLAVRKIDRNGSARARLIREQANQSIHCNDDMRFFLKTIRDETDVLVGDSTQPTYYAMWLYEPNDVRQYFHSVTGFGTLGYAIPAAIGAKVAMPNSRVTCLIGDGGAQFTIPEIHTAQQLKLGIPFVVWNNHGYGEIDKAMRAQTDASWYESPEPPDFRLIAQAHGACYSKPVNLAALGAAIRVAHVSNHPTLIEVDQGSFLNHGSLENWYQ